eukprot:CAMPEP_0118955704 /NCGR_PEP_ID=MMETSP1169-20130426/60372_1 /TAXON_ID=36882 /ORGANISM="Pyramimonas obovata, Strain CCMP722" /LENGTH=377 /DNA_ID=CAMNT_0006903597 /DNA_START=119 /DNA_END=1248 /DNA_ORIENTATION=-
MSSYAAHLDLKPIQGNFITMIKAAIALPVKKERGARMDLVCGFSKDEEEEDAEGQRASQSATQPERTAAQTETSAAISSISDRVRDLQISQQADAGGSEGDNCLKTSGCQTGLVPTSVSARDPTLDEVESHLTRLAIEGNSSSSQCANASERGKGLASSTLSLRESMLPFMTSTGPTESEPLPSSELTTSVKVVAGPIKSSSFTLELSASEPFGPVAAPSRLKPAQRPRTPGRDRTNMNDPTDKDYIFAEAVSFANPLPSPRCSLPASPRLPVHGAQSPALSRIPTEPELEMAHKQAVWNRQRQSVLGAPGGTKGVPGAQTCTRNGRRQTNKRFLDRYNLGKVKLFQEGRGLDSGPSSSSKRHPIQRLQQQGVVKKS